MKTSSKRKRTRAELEEVKQEESEFKNNKQQFFSSKRRLTADVQSLNSSMVELKQYETLVHQLHSSGVIDQHGTPTQSKKKESASQSSASMAK